jgi:hypothetical protein
MHGDKTLVEAILTAGQGAIKLKEQVKVAKPHQVEALDITHYELIELHERHVYVRQIVQP